MVSSGTGTFTTGAGDITLNGDTTISGTKTFSTGTGSVSLNGATSVADDTTFSVGTTGSGGNVQLFGDTYIGGSGAGKSSSLTIYGAVTQNDDADGTAKTFSTATGTVNLKGNVAIATDKSFAQAGTGTFSTGTGGISLNGNTDVVSSNEFKIRASVNAAITCTNTVNAVANVCVANR